MSTDLTRIVSRLSEIDRMQTNLLAEKDELLTAKRVLERLHATAAPGEHPRSLSKPDSADSFIAEMIERNDETNKALFLRVLRDNSSPWMSANEIKETASRLKGRPIPMASISPTLTQLKLDGKRLRSVRGS